MTTPREIVEAALSDPTINHLPIRQIAQMIGVSHQFISLVRKEICGPKKAPKKEVPPMTIAEFERQYDPRPSRADAFASYVPRASRPKARP